MGCGTRWGTRSVLQPLLDPLFDAVAGDAEPLQLLRFRKFGVGDILERPLENLAYAGEHARAFLLRFQAQGDDVVEGLPSEELIDALGALAVHIHAGFGHYLMRQWMQFPGGQSGAEHLELVAAVLA